MRQASKIDTLELFNHFNDAIGYAHKRTDAYEIHTAGNVLKLLGQDTHVEEVRYQFGKLPKQEQDIINLDKNCGEYGLSHQLDRPEVLPALRTLQMNFAEDDGLMLQLPKGQTLFELDNFYIHSFLNDANNHLLRNVMKARWPKTMTNANIDRAAVFIEKHMHSHPAP